MSAGTQPDAERLMMYARDFRRLEDASKRAFDAMADSLTPPFKVAPRQCEEARSNVLKCYEQHSGEVFMCHEEVRQFSQCSNKLFAAHLDLVNAFQVKREEHKRLAQQ